MVLLLALASTGIAGCASVTGAPVAGTPGTGDPGTSAPRPITPIDPFGCGLVVNPATAVIGAEVVISRAATEPGECATLVPGSTQTLELRASVRGLEVEQSVTTVVGGDGAVEARMRMPTGIRLGRAVITAIPPAELDCTGPTIDPIADDACILPRASVTVVFDSRKLAPVTIVSTDAQPPDLPLTDVPLVSFAIPGPGAGELTLVISGSGCETRPAAFLRTAPAHTLAITSAVIVPTDQDCDALAMPWTTVIAVPDGFRDYDTVTVDNVAAVLLPE